MKLALIAPIFLLLSSGVQAIIHEDSFTDWLMPKVFAKMAENEIVKRSHITYIKVREIEDLNYNPPRKNPQEKLEVYGLGGISYEKLFEKDGKPQINQEPQASTLDWSIILPQRYLYYARNPREQLRDGKWCFVVDFKPKSGQELPWNSLEDEAINRFEGTLWIEIESFSVIRFEASIPQPFSGRKGLIFTYSVYEFGFAMDQELFSGVSVPKKVEITMHFDSWAYPKTHVKHTYTYENRRDTRIKPQQ